MSDAAWKRFEDRLMVNIEHGWAIRASEVVAFSDVFPGGNDHRLVHVKLRNGQEFNVRCEFSEFIKMFLGRPQ